MTADPRVFDREGNSFDLLRLLLAGAVLYMHSWQLGGFGEDPFFAWNKHQAGSGELGVLGFFGLSGFLVTASFNRAPSVHDFLRRRVRRIFPAFWACLIATAFGIAPATYALRHGTLTGYSWFGDLGAFGYVLRNFALNVRQWTIQDVLTGAPYDESMDGSLWSLFPEFCCYLGVAALGLAGALRTYRPLLIAVTLFVFLFNCAHLLVPAAGTPLLPTLVVLSPVTPYILAFLVGGCLSVHPPPARVDWRTILLVGVIGVVLLRLGGFRLAAPLLVPWLVVHTGLAFTIPLHADFSYGLYIYGFPVQQALATIGALRAHWWLYWAASLIVTFAFAAASWYLIERPWLRHRVPLRA